LFVGVDIAAATATVAWRRPGAPITRPITIDQTPSGIAQLHTRLQATGIAPTDTLVVLEATGSYWITLATTLHQAGYAVSVINPMQAHHFAKALLKRAKTDAIDAQTLTQLATQLQPGAGPRHPMSIMNSSSAWPNAMRCWICASRSRTSCTRWSKDPW
jgi:transposase